LISSGSDSEDSIFDEAAQRTGRSADAEDDDLFFPAFKPRDKDVRKPSKTPSRLALPPEAKKKRPPLGEKSLEENAAVERKQTKPRHVTSGKKKNGAPEPENVSPAAPVTQQTPPAPSGKKRSAESYDPKSDAFVAMPLAKKIKLIQDKIEAVKQERANAPRTFKAALSLFCKSQDRALAAEKKKIDESKKALALKAKVAKKKQEEHRLAHSKSVARQKLRNGEIAAQEKILQEMRAKQPSDAAAVAADAAKMANDKEEEAARTKEGAELDESANEVSYPRNYNLEI
jgi:hypothetical protein